MRDPFKTLVAAACGYETAAILSGGRIPTVTQLCAGRRWLIAAAVTGLAVHLIRAPVSRLPVSR